jgi:predicted Zn-dependent protease
VVAGRKIKAQSDGATIQLGQAFAASLTDEELAFAIAHELAHVALDHRAKLAAFELPAPNKESKRERARLAKLFEDEADLLSLHLLADAGWDPAIAPRFMRGKGRKFDGGSRVHRKAPDRARLMEQEIGRMPKSAQGENAP